MYVIAITGTRKGIGNDLANYYLEKGFIVAGCSRKKSSIEHKNYRHFTLDVADESLVKDMVNSVKKEFGKIDALINNAGIGFTGPIEESSLSDVESLFKTNFFGPLEMIKQVLPIMRKNGGGLIINITSIAAYIGLPFRGIYCASKSALEIITESLRMEVKDFNINIVNIAPGDFKTDIVKRRIDSFNDKNSLDLFFT